MKNPTNTDLLDKLNGLERMLQAVQPKPLTMREAAAFLDISLSHLYKLTSSGKIPHFKPSGKRVYFDQAELADWLKRNPVKTQEQLEQEAASYIVTKGAA